MNEGTQQDLQSLRQHDRPAWLWDIERRRIVWATDAAVVFWREATLLDLLARDFGPDDVSVRSFERAKRHVADASPLTARLQLNPDHETVFANCEITLYQVGTGRPGLLVEIEHVEESGQSPEHNPEIALARHAPVALSLYGIDGALVTENQAASDLFGTNLPTDLSGRISGGDQAVRIILRVLADGICSRTVRVNTKFGVRRHRLTAKRASHPLTGSPAFTVHVRDIEDSYKIWMDVARVFEDVARRENTFWNKESATDEVTSLFDHMSHRMPKASARLRVFDEVAWGVISFLPSGIIDYANTTAVHLLNPEEPETDSEETRVVGKRFSTLLDPATKDLVMNALSTDKIGTGNATILSQCPANLVRSEGPLSVTLSLIGVNNDQDGARYYAVFEEAGELEAASQDPEDGDRTSELLSFVASLSHDMRTPLNAIKGFSEIMRDEHLGPLDNDRYKDYVSDIHSSSTHLLGLVNNLLELSKIKAGQFDVRRADVNLKQLMADCARMLLPLAKEAGVTLSLRASNHLPSVHIDPDACERVLLNLLSNAVKFSNQGDKVYLVAKTRTDGGVTIQVKDSGPGMSADDVEIALQPFRQTQSARKLASEKPHLKGTGLGLPLAKALTEANSGSFKIDSTPGTGTTVSITFPADLAAVPG